MVRKSLDMPAMAPGSTCCGDMQMLCHRARGERLICTYLSSLDAVMGSRSLHGDEHFWPIDFRCVDTRVFMDQNGRLIASVNYGYAVDRNRLVVGEDAHPVMVYIGDSFDVPRERRDHFSVGFSARVVERISGAFERAGLSNFAGTLEAVEKWSAEQIAYAEDHALARIPPVVHVDELKKNSMDQYAIYDPESGDWVFADFD